MEDGNEDSAHWKVNMKSLLIEDTSRSSTYASDVTNRSGTLALNRPQHAI